MHVEVQRATLQGLFSSSIFMQVPEIKHRLSGLLSKCFYPLSHLADSVL